MTDDEISKRLKEMKGWKHEGAFIKKVFEFPDFMSGIAFVGTVARVAEKEEHHPDILISYTTVTLAVQTHSEGGITEWDLDLAGAIERTLRNKERHVKR